MTKLLVVPLCAVAGLAMLLSAVVLTIVDFQRHTDNYGLEPDTTRMFLMFIRIHHQLQVLFIASVWALLGVALWIIALALALGRL